MLLCGISPVVVVLGYRGREVEAVLHSRYLAGTVIPVYNRDFASTDMLASIQLGAAALPPCSAFFLMPGDMPVVTKETFLTVCRARSGGVPSITFPTLDGYRKHPPLIDCAFIPGICSYQGSDGCAASGGCTRTPSRPSRSTTPAAGPIWIRMSSTARAFSASAQNRRRVYSSNSQRTRTAYLFALRCSIFS